MKDSGTLLGNELVVEAKYRTMCRLIEASGHWINVDLPCGYTPKALHLTAKGLRFIGLDLPIVAGEAGPILSALADHPERMRFEGVDATYPDSLAAALKDVREPIFLANLRGRMDTITAPELLKAWEAEKGGASITAAEIDCSRLQYISSAGLRVLLILQKGGAWVRLTGVNDAVWEILEATGFIDIFAVEREGAGQH